MRNDCFIRIELPRIVESSGRMVAATRERYILPTEAGRTPILEFVRYQLRPIPEPSTTPE